MGKLSASLDGLALPYQFNIDLLESQGAIRDNRSYWERLLPHQTNFVVMPSPALSSGAARYHPFHQEIDILVENLPHDTPVVSDVLDACRSQAITLTIAESAATGRPVAVSLPPQEQASGQISGGAGHSGSREICGLQCATTLRRGIGIEYITMTRAKNPGLVKSLLSEQVMRILTDRITDCAYPMGTRIDIEAIKKEYGISHIPVRDALHKLAEQGLVTVVPRIGFFVVQFTSGEVEDLLNVRALLELSALYRDLKTIDKKTLQFLVSEYRAYKARPNRHKANTKRFFELGEILHRDVILRNAASPLTERIYAGLLTKIRIATRSQHPAWEDIDEHLKIIRALLEENAPAARKALNEHFSAVRIRALSRLAEYSLRSTD